MLCMPESDRELWITILEAASANLPDEMSDEWKRLMDNLKLDYSAFPSLLQAIKEGRWRGARNPRAYIRKVAGTLERKAIAREEATAGGASGRSNFGKIQTQTWASSTCFISLIHRSTLRPEEARAAG